MPRYDYRCSAGHVTELVHPINAAPPERWKCGSCRRQGTRVFCAPAAIHYHGPGFYSTDVKGKLERRRRPNPGDSLPRQHDPAAAALAA